MRSTSAASFARSSLPGGSCTHSWEDPDPDDQETVVTLTFERVGENTKLSLDQGSFKTDARYELHEGGWIETLDRLERSLTRTH